MHSNHATFNLQSHFSNKEHNLWTHKNKHALLVLKILVQLTQNYILGNHRAAVDLLTWQWILFNDLILYDLFRYDRKANSEQKSIF